MDKEFSISVSQHDSKRVIHFGGELTYLNGKHLRKEIEQAVTEGFFHVVLNLARCRHVDSGGLGILAICNRIPKQSGGSIVICNVTEDVARLLRETGLDKVFAMYPSIQEALAA